MEEVFVLGYTAVVLVGGVGSRLRPLTLTRPKPLIPFAGKPLVEHIIAWLRNHGYTRFILTAKYLGEMIKKYYEGVNDVLVRVVNSKDTADAVRLVSDLIGSEDILISMGDVVCNADFKSFMEFHKSHGGTASIALKEVDNPLHYGVVIVDEDNRIKHFVEKPASIELYVLSLAFSRGIKFGKINLVNTGFYIVSPRVIDIIRKYPSLMDWGKHVFPYLIEQGYKVYGWIMGRYAYWEDLGRISNYVKALHDLLDGKIKGYKPAGREVSKGIYVGENAEILGTINPPVYIGDNVFIDKDAVVGPYVSIEKGTRIEGKTRISYSIIWEKTIVMKSSIIGSILMDNVVVNEESKITSSIIGSNNVISSNIRLSEEIINPVAK